jgi:uroporphyrinogen-III synthase
VRLLVTRPQPDAARFAAALAEIGVGSLVVPLMTVEVDAGATPELAGCTAIAVTSANGVRALAQLTADRGLPVWAVGPASAAEAVAQGFTVAGVGGGNVETLAAAIGQALDPGSRVYHAAGADVAGDLGGLLAGRGIACRRQVLYRASIPAILPAEIAAALADGDLDGAVFFSPRSAGSFVRLVAGAGQAVACTGLTAYALSPAVAAACGTIAWRRVREARTPTQEALIDTIRADLGPGNAG